MFAANAAYAAGGKDMNEIVILSQTFADERVVSYGIDKEWLSQYLLEVTTQTLEKFLKEYTSDDSSEIIPLAILADKAAFIDDPGASPTLSICGVSNSWKMHALLDHVSQELQDAGFEDASKYLDCALEL